MSFWRGPFHLSQKDPAKRREELLKRFNSLRSDDGHNMFADPSPMASNWHDWPSDWPQGRIPRRTYEEPEWRTPPSHFTQTGSNPGSPHFTRSGMSMPHGPGWIPDEETIPIKVVHEKGNVNNRPDDSAESDSSSHSSQGSSSQKRTEPRIHHIPIMIEPRDGSTSSGYASCDEAKSANQDTAQERSPKEPNRWPNHNVHQTRMSTEPSATANGACRQPTGQPSYQSPMQDSPGSPKSSPMSTPQPTSDASPFGARTKVHSIPIKIENDQSPVGKPSPLRTQSAKVATSPSKPSVVNRSASSPLSGQFKSTSRGAHCGKNNPKQGASAPCLPSGSSGPYITKVPVNVESHGPQQQRDESHGNRQATGMTPPPSHHTTPTKSPSGPLEKIAEIRKEVEHLKRCIEEFQGTARDKEYRYLDEMLTRCMLRLDDINTGGRDDIRQQRKACVNEVHQCVAQLEAKGKKAMPSEPAAENDGESAKNATLNEPSEKTTEQEAMQIEQNQGATTEEQMQVDEPNQQEKKDENTPKDASTEERKMECDPLSASMSQSTEDKKLDENALPQNENIATVNSSNSMPMEVKEQSQENQSQAAAPQVNTPTEQHEQQSEETSRPNDNNSAQSEFTRNLPTVHRTEVTINVSEESPDPPIQQTKL